MHSNYFEENNEKCGNDIRMCNFNFNVAGVDHKKYIIKYSNAAGVALDKILCYIPTSVGVDLKIQLQCLGQPHQPQ